MTLDGKTAVVTGGTRGIGRATALALAGMGYRVAICGKNRTNLASAEKEIKEEGHDVLAVLCDLAKKESIRKFSDSVKKKFGKIDVLVNNAGIAYYNYFSDMDEKKMREMIDVNVTGLILVTKHLLPSLGRDAVIVNISSGAGKNGIAGLAAYCATKFAVVGFTEALAQEIKQKVFAVCPGGVDTEMYMSMSSHRPHLKPEHIAAKVAEICSEPGKFRSGSSIEIYKITDTLEYLRMKYVNEKRRNK